MASTAMLIWSLIFGSIGIGYFVYGRKQRRILAFVTGILLMIFPYFVSSTVLVVVIGTLLVTLPYLVSKLNI